MAIQPSRLLIALIMAIILCLSLIVLRLSIWRDPAPSELLLFTEIGRSAAGDKLRTIDQKGRNVKTLIPLPEGTTIQSASCASVSGVWVVLVHNITRRMPDKLYLYRPGPRGLSALPTGDGFDGRAVISPSGKSIAYMHAPSEQPSAYALWVMDLATEQTRQTSRIPAGTWDLAPSWSPNEKDIAFIRISSTPRGAISRPMLLNLDHGETKELLDVTDGVSGVAFGGSATLLAILTRRGVELFDFVSGERQMIMPSSRLEGRGWRLGGIGMSKENKKVVFAVFDRKSWSSELWSISTTAASTARSIYKVHDATIETPSFVSIN